MRRLRWLRLAAWSLGVAVCHGLALGWAVRTWAPETVEAALADLGSNDNEEGTPCG